MSSSSSEEKRLRTILRRLVEVLDYAHISFEGSEEVEIVERGLEFDEIYLDACEALGMDLAGSARDEKADPRVQEPAGSS